MTTGVTECFSIFYNFFSVESLPLFAQAANSRESLIEVLDILPAPVRLRC